MVLTMNGKELQKYAREKTDIVGQYDIACHDYIASRLCFFNDMTEQSYILAAQAIEKMLKSILLLKNGKVSRTHDLDRLFYEVSKDINLKSFREINNKLNISYSMFRYPDNYPKTGKGGSLGCWGGSEINKIDEYFMCLLKET